MKTSYPTSTQLISKIKFPESIIERVKCNWLFIKNKEKSQAKTDNDMVIEFVRLSNENRSEYGLSKEIAEIAIPQIQKLFKKE